MPKLYSCKFSGTNYRAVLLTAVLIGHRSGSLAPRTEFAPEKEPHAETRRIFILGPERVPLLRTLYLALATSCRVAADFGSGEGFTTQDVIPSPCNIIGRRGGFWVRRGG